jgi:plasmid replication initiation protein
MAELVVKDNALIQASYTLDTVEQRLILLAIAEARETGQGITENSLLEVHASSYINTFNVEKHTAYTVLRDASRSLFDRYVTYHDINPKTGKTEVSTVDGWIKLVMNINQGLYSYVSLKILSL